MVCRDLNIITYAKNMFSLEANKVVAVIMLPIFRFFGFLFWWGIRKRQTTKIGEGYIIAAYNINSY